MPSIGSAMTTAALVCNLMFSAADPALADGQTKEFKLPPIDFADKSRCTLSSSNIGQANAARDKLYDLKCVIFLTKTLQVLIFQE